MNVKTRDLIRQIMTSWRECEVDHDTIIDLRKAIRALVADGFRGTCMVNNTAFSLYVDREWITIEMYDTHPPRRYGMWLAVQE